MKTLKKRGAPPPTPEISGSIPKRGRGAPKGNRNARKHGLYSASLKEQASQTRELRLAIEAMITLVKLRMMEKAGNDVLQ